VAKENRPALPNAKTTPPAEKQQPRMDQPFDHWLHKQLHEMYDAIAKEPLPDDLLRLIDEDEAHAKKPSTSVDGSSKKKS
jgi:hypothetical protein